MLSAEDISFSPESEKPDVYLIKGKEYSYDHTGVLRSLDRNIKAVCFPYTALNNAEMVITDNGKLIPITKPKEN